MKATKARLGDAVLMVISLSLACSPCSMPWILRHQYILALS